MRRRTLGPPKPAAAEHPRAHFDPKSGWFRKIERAASLFLSRHVWHHVPGIAIPYSAVLDRFLTVTSAEIPIAGLPPPFDGTTLLFLSDVHAGPFVSKGAVARAFARLASLKADVVIHGGDMASSNVKEILPHRDAVSRLTAPLGAFAVYGNHDHYTHDPAGVAQFFASCGVRFLNNDAVALRREGAQLALAAIDDWNFGKPDLNEALARASRVAPGAPVVLISHNPDALLESAARGVALVLSGHTHGGQMRIPGRPVLVRMSRYRLDEGRYLHGGTQLVVGRGLGVSGIPMRIACSPEAVLVTLVGVRSPIESLD